MRKEIILKCNYCRHIHLSSNGFGYTNSGYEFVYTRRGTYTIIRLKANITLNCVCSPTQIKHGILDVV